MIEMFIRHVLGVGTDHRGLYGETSGYYGTVEQQGRLTLHLHMLLWIRGCLTPDEIRSKILDPESDFRLKLVEYLESAHAGDFILKDRAEVEEDVHAAEQDVSYRDPTETLPEGPPSACHNIPVNCDEPTSILESWWSQFRATVNDLLLKSNIHKCSTNRNKDGSQNKTKRAPTKVVLITFGVNVRLDFLDHCLIKLKLIWKQVLLISKRKKHG